MNVQEEGRGAADMFSSSALEGAETTSELRSLSSWRTLNLSDTNSRDQSMRWQAPPWTWTHGITCSFYKVAEFLEFSFKYFLFT